MAIVVERAESNTASPEDELDDDIITVASEIASRDMGAESPPPPPPSQRELREKWGHLPDDMKMSPGGLPMPAELPPVPQSIIDRNSAEPESTKRNFFDRFRRESPVELPPLQSRAMDVQTPTVPENTEETIKPSDPLNANDPAEKARTVMLAKMDAQMTRLTRNESDEDRLKTTKKQFKELKDWLPGSDAGSTAQDYVDSLHERQDAAEKNLKWIDAQPHAPAHETAPRSDTYTAQEYSTERGKAVQELEMVRWANQNFLPTVAKPEEAFAPPPPPPRRS